MSVRRVIGRGFIVVVVAVAALGLWWWRGSSGPVRMNPLERWCADQLRRAAEDLLAPELSFSTLELDLPVTVTLRDVALTSGAVAIARMTSLQLEFRERPQHGKPLVIRTATFVDPEVRLIEQADGTLLGFGQFMKSTTGRRYEDGGSSRPSDLLAIRHITIRDGTIEWAQAGHDQPMRFEELSADFTTSPDSDRPGWYQFKAEIDRPPVVELDWDGGISIDTGDLAFDDSTLKVDLTEDEYASLTPSVQDVLRRYSIVGDLTVRTTGVLPLANVSAADLAFDVALAHAAATVGAYHFPVESASMKARFQDMSLAYDPLTAQAFGGQLDASGSVGFVDAQAFALNVTARGLLLQSMVRAEAGKEPELAGKMDLELEASGERREPDPTLAGAGMLSVVEGKLIRIPMFGAIADAVKVPLLTRGNRDRAEFEFTLSTDRLTIDRSVVESEVVAARGTGAVHYDGRLEGRLNAGFIEKAQRALGPIGQALSGLTDRLLPYEISGTWSKPIVKPVLFGVPLGGGAESP